VGFGSAQAFVLGVGGVVKGDADGVDGRHLHFVIPGDFFAVHVDVPAHRPQPFDVLLFGSHPVPLLSLFEPDSKGFTQRHSFI
jgi:hypothetical protein